MEVCAAGDEVHQKIRDGETGVESVGLYPSSESPRNIEFTNVTNYSRKKHCGHQQQGRGEGGGVLMGGTELDAAHVAKSCSWALIQGSLRNSPSKGDSTRDQAALS